MDVTYHRYHYLLYTFLKQCVINHKVFGSILQDKILTMGCSGEQKD